MKMRTWLVAGLVAMLAVACSPDDSDATNNGGDVGTDVVDTTDTSTVCDEIVYLEESDINGGVTLEEDCYAVESVLTLSDGTLELSPGVNIEFAQDAGLEITGNGSLSAIGSSSKPVVLTGAEQQRGYWAGIYFNQSNSSNNVFEYVDLEYAGGAEWTGSGDSRGGIYIRDEGNALDVSSTIFRGNAFAAVNALSAGIDLSIADSGFENNALPLRLHVNLFGSLSSLTFANNDESYVTTLAGAGETVSSEQTWEALDVPYRIRKNVFLGAKLTLQPGVTIQFAQDVGMDIGGDGRLSAAGSQDAPITLTGIQEERGHWAGLYFHDTLSSDNVLDHVTVEYGGGDGWTGGASSGGVFIREDGVALEITNSTFRENAAAGVFANSGGSDFSIASSTFENNELPVWLQANNVGGIAADNSFEGNDSSYVLVGVGNSTGVSDDQTWPALSVPYHVQSDVYVSGALTVSPGTTMAFEQDVGLLVKGGTLAADASEGDRIRFIAANGETIQGYWSGIGFTKSNSGDNIIRNADVMYGGYSEWIGDHNDGPGNIVLDNDSGETARLHLENVELAGSGGPGLQVGDGSTVEPCSGLTFDNNSGANVAGSGTYSCN